MIPGNEALIPDYLERIKDYPNLTLEELGRDNLRFFQVEDSFKFGNEQVFLAHFAKSLLNISTIRDLEKKKREFRIIDPGAGSGILSVLSSALIPNASGLSIELMERPYNLLQANLIINRLSKRFTALQADIRELVEQADYPTDWGIGSFDMAICNPPYFKPNAGAIRDTSTEGGREVEAARDEVHITLDEYINFVSKSLKQNGTMVILNRPERLVDVINTAEKHGLKPYLLRQIKTKEYNKPKAFLLAAKKTNKASFKWAEDLIIYETDGSYNPEVAKYYEGD